MQVCTSCCKEKANQAFSRDRGRRKPSCKACVTEALRMRRAMKLNDSITVSAALANWGRA